MKIRFTTPCIYDGEGFGCASFGFAGAPDPAKETIREWNAQYKYINGQAYYGRLDDVIAQIPARAIVQGQELPWLAGIVLFGNCGDENSFIRKLHEKTGCPLTGGAAACDPVTGKSGLITGGKVADSQTAAGQAAGSTAGDAQVAVYMICDQDRQIEVVSKNIHSNVLGTHKIGFTDPRVFETIDGEDAVEWFAKKRAEYGFGPDDFEHMTFSDLNNVNAHTSLAGGKLVSGRDLCPEMSLRYVKKGEVYPQMNEFYNDKDAMIFGCAGLKGILEEDIMTDTMGMFMFGEVATMSGIPEFGNLMLSKIVIR